MRDTISMKNNGGTLRSSFSGPHQRSIDGFDRKEVCSDGTMNGPQK